LRAVTTTGLGIAAAIATVTDGPQQFPADLPKFHDLDRFPP
jgi:hypothetical protein